ncbi:hypothetical protein E2I00_013332, partial [Balaenoptera physalus]
NSQRSDGAGQGLLTPETDHRTGTYRRWKFKSHVEGQPHQAIKSVHCARRDLSSSKYPWRTCVTALTVAFPEVSRILKPSRGHYLWGNVNHDYGKSSKVLQCVNCRLRCILQDGQIFIGIFKAFDKHVNLILCDRGEIKEIRLKNAKQPEHEEKQNLVSVTVEGKPPNILTLLGYHLLELQEALGLARQLTKVYQLVFQFPRLLLDEQVLSGGLGGHPNSTAGAPAQHPPRHGTPPTPVGPATPAPGLMAPPAGRRPPMGPPIGLPPSPKFR